MAWAAEAAAAAVACLVYELDDSAASHAERTVRQFSKQLRGSFIGPHFHHVLDHLCHLQQPWLLLIRPIALFFNWLLASKNAWRALLQMRSAAPSQFALRHVQGGSKPWQCRLPNVCVSSFQTCSTASFGGWLK